MAKHKLARFAENETFDNLFQHTSYEESNVAFPLRGRWNADYFHNGGPIVLELGCGKGEYTLAMARCNAGGNFVGVDRKGARLWRGCKDALSESLSNVAFLRVAIDHLDYYFAPGEVAEIWVTFPDPQPKRERRRLVSPPFVSVYRRILPPEGGLLHLKTDSRMLYDYVTETAAREQWEILMSIEDVYDGTAPPLLTDVQTYYERKWLALGMKISYLKIKI